MDRPPPDPVKLLSAWMEWERGEVTPGRTMATLKTGGLRTVLEEMAAAAPDDSGGAGGQGDAADRREPAAQQPSSAAESWTPVV
jgi:hypothetical protein